MNFIVSWTIDVEADSPRQAAQEAATLYFQQRIADGTPDTACVFEVRPEAHGTMAAPITVDLSARGTNY